MRIPLYSESLLDEVRNSVNIVSLVSEYVALRKRGRNWVARCPFHVEKTPSFNVNEERQIFMCFGCGLGGDVFKFVMQIEHVGFPEAVRWLADRHGIPLPKVAPSEVRPEGAEPDTLRAVMKEAARYFHRILMESEEGKNPLQYMLDRGVSRETLAQFNIGYAPAGGNALGEYLRGKGHASGILEECGLLKRAEEGRTYDAFRGRVMFPIADIQGRVIAFGGRTLGDRQPKYLNSPETRLYNKSRNLFGLSASREEIKRADCAILVEGYMDFIVPFQHGIRNLVASLGTSLTAQQVKLLGRYTRNVIVSYDPDSAGQAATQRSLDLFLEEDFQVGVFRLPQGQDPDTYVRTVGAEEYRGRLQEAVPYLDFVLDTAIRGQGSVTHPKGKIQVLNAVLPYLAKIPHAVERSEYVFRFARRLGIDDGQLLAEVRRAARQKQPRLSDSAEVHSLALRFAEKRLLQLLLARPQLQPELLASCSLEDFHGLAAERIFELILERHRRGGPATFEQLHLELAGADDQSLLAKLQMEEVPEGSTLESARSCLDALRAVRLESRKQQILAQIAEAAERKDEETLNQLIEQRVLVDRELVSLSRK